MASALKGITVEIGGDTTKLQDALSGLGRRAGETGRDLASIENALKFNPDSVELLAQKERYASQQAETLRQRLDVVNAALSGGQVERGSRAYDQLQRELVTTTSKLERMEAAQADARVAMERLASESGNAADGVSELGDAADESSGKLGELLKNVREGALLAFGEDALDAAKRVAEMATAYEDAAARVRAAVGGAAEAGEALTRVGSELYSAGWGGSLSEVTDAAIRAREALGDLSQEDLSTVTRAAMTLEGAFGSDVSESLRGVSVLMERFGLTAREASDLMVAGSQRGLDYTDELGDNLAEYAGRWADAGISATQYFSLLQAGVDAGAYSLDRVGDYLNEFLTSLSDGRMADSVGSFSASTQELWESYQGGGRTRAHRACSLAFIADTLAKIALPTESRRS